MDSKSRSIKSKSISPSKNNHLTSCMLFLLAAVFAVALAIPLQAEGQQAEGQQAEGQQAEGQQAEGQQAEGQQAEDQTDLFRLVTLKPAFDEFFTNDIQEILDSYHWSRPYATGNFSCTDTSIYTMLLLEQYGYTAVCMTNWGPDNRSLNDDPVGHMWVAVNNPRHNESWIFIDGNGGFHPNKKPLSDSIGQIIYGEMYQTGYITTDPLDYLEKYDSNPRQPWRQYYSLNDSNAPKPNAP